MTRYTVALKRTEDYTSEQVSKNLKEIFELLGGLDKFVKAQQSVLIKPNLIAPKSRRCATQTDPVVIIELAKLIKDCGARPFIADSPAWSGVKHCIRKLKIDEQLTRLGVPVKPLDRPRRCKIGDNLTVGISSVALEADVIINLPKFKSHQQLAVTFAVKNIFGCVSGKAKALWHFRKGESIEQFCSFLIEIYKYINPAVTIIDGVVAMDGHGPINGNPKPLGWLIGSTDAMAAERVCARLINREPETLPMIRTARQLGFGCNDDSCIDIAGDRFENMICTDFEIPELIEVKFTLPRICKSIAKQIVLLTRASFERYFNKKAG